METDIFADEDGFRAMYTPESAALLGKGLSGSVANVNLMGEDDHTPMVELIPRDPSTSKAFSLSLSLPLTFFSRRWGLFSPAKNILSNEYKWRFVSAFFNKI